MSARRSVEVYDIASGMGGSFTVEIVEDLPADRVKLRVWYGRASPQGWVPWRDWDGFHLEGDRAQLSNKRTMPLFKSG